MNEESQPNHDRLRAVLREARPAPPLPLRFQESVWRRLEREETAAIRTPSPSTWLEQWVERLLLPRFALAGLGLVLLAGGLTGVISSPGVAKEQAQERYLSVVAPSTLR